MRHGPTEGGNGTPSRKPERVTPTETQVSSDLINSGFYGRVRSASVIDVDAMVPMFEEYRALYRGFSNEEATRQFLFDRIRFNQAIVFLAEDLRHLPMGFALVYPSFSSVDLTQIFLVSDLFVVPSHRRKGAGAKLLDTIWAHAHHSGASKLRLSNPFFDWKADDFYERHGWERIGWERTDDFRVYELSLAQRRIF